MRNRTSLYQKLWSQKHAPRSQTAHAEGYIEKIDELCFRADLCEKLEDYAMTLCEGMEDLLSDPNSTKYLKSHPVLEDKIKRLGLDIVDRSDRGSEFYYIGVFADFKLAKKWLTGEVYTVIKKLIHQVSEFGLKLSCDLKQKIKQKCRLIFPAKFQYFFGESALYQSSPRYWIPI